MASFSISGIRIRIDHSWFIAFFLFSWTLSEGYFPIQAPNYSAIAYWIFGSLSTAALFASVLIHELSHCVVARRLGIEVRQITLFIFGGVSEMAPSESNTPSSEFRTTIAGPLASFGLGLMFGLTAFVLQSVTGRITQEMLHYLQYINILLAIFNLLPGFPLDGGRILRSYLWHRSGDIRQATRATSRIGEGFAVGIIAIGLMSMVAGHLMMGIWLIIIGVFLKRSAEREYRSVQVRATLEHLKVGEIMAPPVAVKKGTTVAELVRDFVFHYHDRVFPVIDRGQFIGMIDVRASKKIPAADWPHTYIDAFMADSSQYCVLDPDTEARDALYQLLEHQLPKAPVVRNDVLVGVLTRHDMVEVIALKNDLAA